MVLWHWGLKLLWAFLTVSFICLALPAVCCAIPCLYLHSLLYVGINTISVAILGEDRSRITSAPVFLHCFLASLGIVCFLSYTRSWPRALSSYGSPALYIQLFIVLSNAVETSLCTVWHSAQHLCHSVVTMCAVACSSCNMLMVPDERKKGQSEQRFV